MTIPGQLSAGSVQAGNLDDTLKALAAQITALTSKVDSLQGDVTALRDQLSKDAGWIEFAPNVGTAIAKVDKDRGNLTKYEFGMIRNDGFRRVHFSTWNNGFGFRLMTEPYMTEDKTPFILGGSMWVTPGALAGMVMNGMQLPVSSQCQKSGEAFHMYYKYTSDGVQAKSGNGCRTEGIVYARERRLIP